ncbi:hypothetical protein EYC84_000742 [Monilinia fructicola]|uniref:Uncharacterized protein n=1 Tax=Monilinia fructicola TaxID=38448 RepID=A0A5M9JMP3_MONFR|nr:hypothetical protein EYC84_000742 [Monilinia fructicola]
MDEKHVNSKHNEPKRDQAKPTKPEPQEFKDHESHLAALLILYRRWDEIKARDGIPPIAVDKTNSFHGSYVKPTTDLDMIWSEIVGLRKHLGMESQGPGKEKWCRWCKESESEGKEFEHWV